MLPSVPELVDFFVRLEDDPACAGILDGAPFQIFQKAVKEGLVEHLEQDGFAWVIGKAVGRELIGFERIHAGIGDPGAVWSDHDFQMRSGYFVTVQGRQMADLYRRRSPLGRIVESVDTIAPQAEKAYDVFISHASEDKDDFVRNLAHALQRRSLAVWYDEFALRVGDSLRRKIDAGLSSSRFGVVVLSPNFFAKNWSQYELDGMVTREMTGAQQIILPIWHNVSRDEVVDYSPALADKLALKSSESTIEEIASQIAEVVAPS
jgi:hypothetical protein